MKHELRLFFVALQFYTRLPIPAWVGYSESALNQATRYLPLIGWLVGAVTGLVWLAGTYLIDADTALLLGMTASVLLTGAFHEDGFADVCDGFGGGWTKERILTIMKDSRVGTYGVVGLVLMLGLKFSVLKHIGASLLSQPGLLLMYLMSAHALSRFMAATFIRTHSYVRETDDSKAKPVAQTIGLGVLVVAGVWAVVPLLAMVWLTQQPLLVLLVPVLYGVKMVLARYFTRWIGGYTGDCLGATQQVCEVSFYLFSAILWKFT
ncbi:adenosylcobinamide-GDP ribazoletransferase [Spirosoma rhododendri]|uniref:Adenosylcobinamide-GDP ribazoletransferase n=1 Tax=Spirosoma rhododendri TaxID=2728024 RepID=A0A7L5DMF0_9BACT|nr:adenosylcobinamide-GDP ribazoletransferase [Spirosoma rhododendri]QJD79639.1 adenosylcobinamide-GDP ribazoletransferase [Spirosoma rhododendri]